MRNYLSEMLYALTSAYSRKDYDNCKQRLPLETNIGKLFSILAQGLASVEEKTEMVKLWDNLDYACGSVLDRYGANFGVKRISPDDRFYRLAIKVKVMAQLSGGDINTVTSAIAELFDIPIEAVEFDEVFPAKVRFIIEEKLLAPEKLEMAETIVLLVKRILAAGVGMHPIFKVVRDFKHDVVANTAGAVHSEISISPPPVLRTFAQTHHINGLVYEYVEISISPAIKGRNIEQLNRVNLVAYELSEINVHPITQYAKTS